MLQTVLSERQRELKKSVTRRYVLAITLIAILSSLAFFSLSFALKGSESTAYIVNISGKQRMLSQHIALDAHKVAHARFRIDNGICTDRGVIYEAKAALQKHTTEMLQANDILSSGQLPNGKHLALSEVIHEMYFGEMNLAQRVAEYNQLALEVLDAMSYSETNPLLSEINSLSEPLLVDLNKVVNQYQAEGEAKLVYISTMETLVWLMTLATLLLEVIFIFQPMVTQIVDLSLKEEFLAMNLQTLVDTRTANLEQANKHLSFLAEHDTLTGLKNRLTMEKEIEQSLDSYIAKDQPFALIMLDIDFFKKVNDELGHDYGDYVIQQTAEILRSIVNKEDDVYRVGGEEFVVLLKNQPLVKALALAGTMRTQVASYQFEFNDTQIQKTISAGLFHTELATVDSVKSILKLADEALYLAKNSGRNNVKTVAEAEKIL